MHIHRHTGTNMLEFVWWTEFSAFGANLLICCNFCVSDSECLVTFIVLPQHVCTLCFRRHHLHSIILCLQVWTVFDNGRMYLGSCWRMFALGVFFQELSEDTYCVLLYIVKMSVRRHQFNPMIIKLSNEKWVTGNRWNTFWIVIINRTLTTKGFWHHFFPPPGTNSHFTQAFQIVYLQTMS